MTTDKRLPDFNEFSRWLSQQPPTAAQPGRDAQDSERYEALASAGRAARDEFLAARHSVAAQAANDSRLEVLQLLAAADPSDSVQVPQMTTARGFRVTLAFDEGDAEQDSSICVLVQCPASFLPGIEGETVYLWNGKERFELGQFDAEGKAIGTLPAGIQITLSDFTQGRVKLEEPPPKE